VTESTKRNKMFGLLALGAAGITTVIAVISGCGGSDNPGGGDRFTMYTLTTGVSPENSGQLSRDPYATSYQNGTEVILTATPAAGYRFDGWSDKSLLQVTPLTITMTKNIDITANFVPISTPEGYSLNVSRVPEIGGTVSRSPDLTHYPAGTEVTLTANAEPGYALDGWSGAIDTNIRIITIVMDDDKELTAHFIPAPYRLTTSATAGGMVTVEPEQESYTNNARVTATAHAEPGYVFVRWTGASALSSNPVTITMNADKELNAIFELIGDNQFTLTTGELIGGTVRRDPEAGAYALGMKVVVTAVPDEGYRFVRWTQGLTSDKATDTVTISGDMVLLALFQRGYTLNIARNPAEGGTVTPATVTTYDAGAQPQITATPASGYRFVNWTSSDGTVAFGNANSASTTVSLSSNTVITANFQAVCTLTVASNPAAGGTATPTSGQQYDAGRAVSISATASSTHAFLNWTVTSGTATFANANNASTTVTMSTNATITANFGYRLTINLNPPNRGTVTPTSATLYNVDTPASITATPAPGFTFSNWTVTNGTATFANESNASTIVTLGSHATISANFIPAVTVTDPRDGQSYRVITIGNQTWMAENLNYDIPGVSTDVCYNNNSINCTTYGRLYTWSTVMDGASSSTLSPSGVQGICPSGWHVPSDAEWTTLTDLVGSSAGTKLKSSSGWGWDGGNGTDDYGFSALPGGGIDNAGYGGSWWSATENDAEGAWSAWYRSMVYGNDGVSRGNYDKKHLFSLRCVRDD